MSNEPVVATLEAASASLDALDVAYQQIGSEIKTARARLWATLEVARNGTPIFVDKKEAERLLGVSESTLNRLLRDGAIPFIKVMGAVRIRRSTIENFLGTKE